MRTDTPKTIYLKDYQPYPYKLRHVDLFFDIRAGETTVTATIKFSKLADVPLFLNGEDIELVSLKMDKTAVKDFARDERGLTLPAPAKDEFSLEIVTRIRPEGNTRLEGLYMSGGNYCTQCEAEGFRRITYYPDRPDVMTTFTVRIEADESFPVLLSNGNLLKKGKAAQGRHFAVWDDPHPKPCYLFALVAGDLAHIHDTFTTKSGRKVDLYIYVRPGDEGQCAHAMESLKKSMKWDEDVYGLEYDLDIFNIVAVSDFNMGAMENKSLNIFNTALVLAHPDTATDTDFLRVESVIAHEYFHNWSGNRVTCRDWFQLSLKEGLTVFRDQEFSADLNSRAVQRIDDVTHLRRLQFAEDSGPLAHPIRPDNYIEINNFYTMTVYEKGAEVIRMMRTILGPDNYRKGTDLYFSRHDGQAVICEDFVKCMEDASGADLSQFRLWYSQAGTPEITFDGQYDADAKIYRVTLSQVIPDTPGQKNKNPMHIPVMVGLVDRNGGDITQETFQLCERQQVFEIRGVESAPVPSVLRGFSAPVRLRTGLVEDDLAFLMIHDSDGFNRWEAGQIMALRTLQSMIDGRPVSGQYIRSFGDLLARGSDPALLARAITLPSVSALVQEQPGGRADPVAIHGAIGALQKEIKAAHRDRLTELYAACREENTFSIATDAMGRRALKNALLELLTANRGVNCLARAKAQYEEASSMTDRVGALSVLAEIDAPDSREAFSDFYERFRSHALVIDKWFALQAAAARPDIIPILKALRAHPDFNIGNPNRARALYASFAMNNPAAFHAADGSGYDFLADAVIELNSINPQIAARLLTPMRDWKRYTPDRQSRMRAALARIQDQPRLSPDVYEIVSKTLAA